MFLQIFGDLPLDSHLRCLLNIYDGLWVHVLRLRFIDLSFTLEKSNWLQRPFSPNTGTLNATGSALRNSKCFGIHKVATASTGLLSCLPLILKHEFGTCLNPPSCHIHKLQSVIFTHDFSVTHHFNLRRYAHWVTVMQVSWANRRREHVARIYLVSSFQIKLDFQEFLDLCYCQSWWTADVFTFQFSNRMLGLNWIVTKTEQS